MQTYNSQDVAFAQQRASWHSFAQSLPMLALQCAFGFNAETTVKDGEIYLNTAALGIVRDNIRPVREREAKLNNSYSASTGPRRDCPPYSFRLSTSFSLLVH